MKSNFMEMVYNILEYKPFDFLPDFTVISRQFNNIPVINRGYAIVLKKNAPKDSVIHESTLLIQHQLVVLKYDDTEMISPVLPSFRAALYQAMLAWEDVYLDMITCHFKSRMSEDKMLNSHDFIKIQVGALVADIACAREMILCSDLIVETSEKLRSIAMDLHKLAGGRVFLQGNVIEMLCLFEIFWKIYG